MKNDTISCADIKRRKYTLNESYFEKIDTAEKAYILGFIYADGNIDKQKRALAIHLKKDDVFILNFIKKSLNSNQPFMIYDDKYILLKITSKKLCSDLVRANIQPNKTYVTKSLPYNGEFFSHFLRGFFDGDGSIWSAKNNPHDYGASFTNNLYVLTEIKDFLKNKLNINSHIRHEKDEGNNFSCSLKIRGSVQLKTIYDFLYKDDFFSLKRKKDRFLISIQDAEKTLKTDFKYNGIKDKIKTLYNNSVRVCDIARILNANYNSVNMSIVRMKERGEIL
jgi:hypothetical protein